MLIRTSKNKDNPYVLINKRFLEDKNLSLKAKGLLAYCMSKPDDWEFRVESLSRALKEGIDAIYSGFKELIEFGYCTRDRHRDATGSFSRLEYTLTEEPIKITLPHGGFGDVVTLFEKEEELKKFQPHGGFPGVALSSAAPYIPSNDNTKFDDDDRTHTHIGCGNVDNIKSDNHHKVTKQSFNGDPITCSKEEYYRYVIADKKLFTTLQVEDAWTKFVNSSSLVGDWKKYLDQIIINKKIQDEKCAHLQMKKKVSEKKNLRETSENSNEKTSERVLKEPRLMTPFLPSLPKPIWQW